MSDLKKQFKLTDGRYALVRTENNESTDIFADIVGTGEDGDDDVILVSSSDDRSEVEYYIQFRTELGLNDRAQFHVVDTDTDDLDSSTEQTD